MRAQPDTAKARPAKKGEGFTMVEILVSMLLLALMLTGLAALQIGTIRNVTDSKRYAGATRLAESVLERFQTMTSTDLPPPDGTWEFAKKKGDESVSEEMRNVGVDGEGNGPYTVHVLVEQIPDGSSRKLVTVRVSWTQSSISTADGGTQTGYRTNSLLMSIERAP